MKHNISELYRIEGQQGTYSADYLFAHNIRVPKNYRDMTDGDAWHLISKQGTNGKLTVHTAYGIRVVYMFGEKTFFDTYEEVLQAKAEYQKLRAEQARRRIALEKLEKLSTANLEKLVEKLGL